MKPKPYPWFRSAPRSVLRRFAPAAAAAILLFGLSACTDAQIREDHYRNGSKKSQSAFVRASDSSLLRHGVQLEWYPSGGKSSLETWVHGYRQGYAIRWHANGRLKSVEHYSDGLRDGQAKSWDEDGNLIACSTPAGDCPREAADGGDGADRIASRP